MTHFGALRVQDEMKQAGMRSFIARRSNGKRWVWIVVHLNGDTKEEYETVAQWRVKRKAVQP